MKSMLITNRHKTLADFDQSFEEVRTSRDRPIYCQMEVQDNATIAKATPCKLFAETYLTCYWHEDLGDFYDLQIVFTFVLWLPKDATDCFVFEAYGQTLKLIVKDDLDYEEYCYKRTAYKKKHPVYAKFKILTKYLMLKIWDLIWEKVVEEEVEIESRDLEMLFNDMMYEQLLNQLFEIKGIDREG